MGSIFDRNPEPGYLPSFSDQSSALGVDTVLGDKDGRLTVMKMGNCENSTPARFKNTLHCLLPNSLIPTVRTGRARREVALVWWMKNTSAWNRGQLLSPMQESSAVDGLALLVGVEVVRRCVDAVRDSFHSKIIIPWGSKASKNILAALVVQQLNTYTWSDSGSGNALGVNLIPASREELTGEGTRGNLRIRSSRGRCARGGLENNGSVPGSVNLWKDVNRAGSSQVSGRLKRLAQTLPADYGLVRGVPGNVGINKCLPQRMPVGARRNLIQLMTRSG
ncbi:hypothetical protein C8R44DRAFT_736227 [Mycena epipterygia]|nr:hypothetical protein C8R44DRAFT_736227 [Mycena epipterygia]